MICESAKNAIFVFYQSNCANTMIHQAIIEHTIQIMNKLPENKATEISDFADFISKRYEEESLMNDIKQSLSNDKCFEFLNEEEELYSMDDLQEVYGG